MHAHARAQAGSAGPASAILFAFPVLFTGPTQVASGSAEAPDRRRAASLPPSQAREAAGARRQTEQQTGFGLGLSAASPAPPPQNNRRRENARVKTSAQCGLFTYSPMKQPWQACTPVSALPLSLCSSEVGRKGAGFSGLPLSVHRAPYDLSGTSSAPKPSHRGKLSPMRLTVEFPVSPFHNKCAIWREVTVPFHQRIQKQTCYYPVQLNYLMEMTKNNGSVFKSSI